MSENEPPPVVEKGVGPPDESDLRIRQIVSEELAKFRKEVTAQVLRIIVNQTRLQGGIRRT